MFENMTTTDLMLALVRSASDAEQGAKFPEFTASDRRKLQAELNARLPPLPDPDIAVPPPTLEQAMQRLVTPEIRRKLVERYGPGITRVRMCPRCGLVLWCSTTTTTVEGREISRENSAITVEPMIAVDECSRCHEVATRSPEIFTWVAHVVDLQTSLAKVSSR